MKKILVIDDDIAILDVLQYTLHKEGYHCDVVNTGKEGLVKLDNNYDLILLDIRLSEESGCSIATIIKERKPDSLIIALSAYVSLAQKAFFDDYIEKPFTYTEFMEKIKLFLRD